MKKSAFITALEKDETSAKTVFQTVQRYGLETGGHFWVDDLNEMAWSAVTPELLKPENSLWVISGAEESFKTPSFRFGLSLLAVMLHDRRGYGLPILVVPQTGHITSDDLPTPLKSADIVAPASLGAKVAAKANIPVKNIQADYTLRLYPIPKLGLWFEVGPAQGNVWNGGLFGVCGGEIDACGVGESGKLPEKAVLEYPMRGLKLQNGEQEFTAWAVQNKLDKEQSLYLRVKGEPQAIMFGELPEGDDAEVYTIQLQ